MRMVKKYGSVYRNAHWELLTLSTNTFVSRRSVNHQSEIVWLRNETVGKKGVWVDVWGIVT
jgi:hypothetical protein